MNARIRAKNAHIMSMRQHPFCSSRITLYLCGVVAKAEKSFIGHESKQVWHLCVLIKNLYSDDNFCVDTYSRIIHVYRLEKKVSRSGFSN